MNEIEEEYLAAFDDLDKIDDNELAQLLLTAEKPAGKAKKPETARVWMPSLTPKQMDVFNDLTPNLLLESMRFTGKSWSVGFAAVRHAYDYPNALVLLVAKTKRQLLVGGLMTKLASDILPEFKNNLDGFTHSPIKMTVEKDAILSLVNRYGGTSIIQMMSIGNDADLARKIKGLEASLVIVDELTLYDTPAIYESLSATLGRKASIPPWAQRFIGTTNPSDPDHWVSKMWNIMDPENRDPAFRAIRLMPEDNPSPQTAAYYERLRQTLRNNPTQFKRDVLGEWVALPKGDAIFKESFNPDIHVRGSRTEDTGLHPQPGFPIILGWDPGEGSNHSVSFLQEIPTPDKPIWILFDEVVHVGKKMSLHDLTRDVMRKMDEWCIATGYNFSFTHVSDNSAFNRHRAATGSYDWMMVEQASQKLLPSFPRLTKTIRMREAPKGDGSVGARSRLLMDLLEREEFFISASCKHHIQMLVGITGKKDDPFAPGTHDPLKHAFDSLTYPLVYFRASSLSASETVEDVIRPQIYQAGLGAVR